jgi:hypothetical protein
MKMLPRSGICNQLGNERSRKLHRLAQVVTKE